MATPSAYEKWVSEQTTTNYRFDPNNYQADANGARYTPGYSAPITTKVNYNSSTPGMASSYNGQSSSGGSSQSNTQTSYQDALTQYQNQIATQAAKAKQDALRSAWEGNSQALNSQKSTVDNNYNSAANKLNAVRDARLPEFQQQRNSASAEAAQIARRNQELMAATGRGDSGYSRSNALATDLNRSNALSSLTSSENQFKTDIGNQKSDIEAQRVAALNDIAEKLTLGEKQRNDGSLSLTNQLQSEIATGSLKAMMDAQSWADQQKQLGIDNSYRQAQFDQNASLAELQQQFQQKQFQAQQDAQLWQQQFQQQGFTADEAYRKAQMQMQQEIQAAEQAYKYAALSKSGSSGGGGGYSSNIYDNVSDANASTRTMVSQIITALQSGATMQEVMADIDQMERDGTAAAEKYDTRLLRNLANSIPVDNWQYQSR